MRRLFFEYYLNSAIYRLKHIALKDVIRQYQRRLIPPLLQKKRLTKFIAMLTSFAIGCLIIKIEATQNIKNEMPEASNKTRLLQSVLEIGSVIY